MMPPKTTLDVVMMECFLGKAEPRRFVGYPTSWEDKGDHFYVQWFQFQAPDIIYGWYSRKSSLTKRLKQLGHDPHWE